MGPEGSGGSLGEKLLRKGSLGWLSGIRNKSLILFLSVTTFCGNIKPKIFTGLGQLEGAPHPRNSSSRPHSQGSHNSHPAKSGKCMIPTKY